MDDENYLGLLKLGVKHWNNWRAKNSNAKVLLQCADLSGMDLRGANLSNFHLREASLIETQLAQANLRGADLTSARLDRSDLSAADLRHCNLGYAKFIKAKLIGVNLQHTSLSTAYLQGADLSDANLHGADFEGTGLADVIFRGARLTATQYLGPYLANLDFSGANLDAIDLQNADLSGSIFRGARLNGADLRGANLSGTILTDATLYFVNLNGADLNEAVLDRAHLSETIFSNVDFSTAKDLDQCTHVGPCVVDHRTLKRSKNVPLAFWRGCGLSDWQIEAAKLSQPSLTQEHVHDIGYEVIRLRADQPIQLFSSFISYSSQDHKFTRQLYDTLKNNDVDCWFAPEDMKIGDRFRRRIDEVIHVHDKLLLVLSEHSVVSQWVEKEVETALAAC